MPPLGFFKHTTVHLLTFSKVKRMLLRQGIVIFALMCWFGSFVGLKSASALENQDARAKSLTHYALGVMDDLQGLNEQALAQYKKSAEYEENYAVYLRLGADYARLGNLEEASTALRRVLDFDSQNVQARYLLAVIYSSQKEYTKAATEYEAILNSVKEADPANIEIYGYLGQLYYAQKEYDKAIKQFETIRSLEPNNADVLYLLGSLYLEVRDHKKAVDLFLKALEADPNHDGCLNSLGYLYADEGTKLDEAEDMIRRALKIDPHNGAYLDSLGWVYYKKGLYEQAISTFEEADSFLKDPVIYEHLGDVYSKLNKKAEAKKYWSLSLDLLPGQEKVLQKIKSLQ